MRRLSTRIVYFSHRLQFECGSGRLLLSRESKLFAVFRSSKPVRICNPPVRAVGGSDRTYALDFHRARLSLNARVPCSSCLLLCGLEASFGDCVCFEPGTSLSPQALPTISLP